MDVGTLIDRTRSEILDDTDDAIGTPLWSDSDLISGLNQSLRKMYKACMVKTDQETIAITQIKLLSNLGMYDLDSRVLKIKNARFSVHVTYAPLEIETETHLDQTITNWRTTTGVPRKCCPNAASGRLSIYPKFDDTYEYVGVSNISFVAATKTISQVGGDFSGLAVDDSVNVDGTTPNEGYLTVATTGTTSFTVSETLVNESNTSATIRKVEDTLIMTVIRLPVTAFTVNDIADATDISDLRSDYHEDLMYGIAELAYLKADSQTFDISQSKLCGNEFARRLKQARIDMILLNKPDRSMKIRSGTGIGY